MDYKKYSDAFKRDGLAMVAEAQDKNMRYSFDPGRIRTYDTPLKRRVLCH
jgi:hypothetical protein